MTTIRAALVTGGTGFLGAHLVGRLAAEGVRVILLVRDRPVVTSLDLVAPDAPVTLLSGDLLDRDLLLRALEEYSVDAVFHLAAQSQVRRALADPWETWETNVRGGVALFEAVRRAGRGIRLLVASSDKAYGPPRGQAYTETDPLLGAAPYDASKSALECVARSYATTYGIPVRVTRAANLYGPGDVNEDRIVPEACRALLAGRKIVLRSDGSPRRDWLWVDDAVDGYLRLAEDAAHGGYEVYNLGTNRETSVREVVEILLGAAGRGPDDLDIQGKGTPPGEISRQRLDASKIAARLDWRPKVPVEEGLPRTLEGYRGMRDRLRRLWTDIR